MKYCIGFYTCRYGVIFVFLFQTFARFEKSVIVYLKVLYFDACLNLAIFLFVVKNLFSILM